LLGALGHTLASELLRLELERYTPRKLAGIIKRRPEELEPRPREATILFSDMRDSTAIAEALAPPVLRQLQHEYFGTMDEIISLNDGILVKTIGDAVMALWNAPEPVANHAACCCRATLAMLHSLAALNDQWRARGWPRVDVRIGIVSGEAMVGIFGTVRHVEYDARGDAVNLSARLEGLNKVYGTRVIVGAATREAIGDEFLCRPLDRVRVVGKTRPVDVYELMALRMADTDGRLVRLAQTFATVVAAYRRRQFAEALILLEQLTVEYRDDGPAAVYLERCRRYQLAPPDAAWDGVFEPTSK
jgi:adenylate cyclase